MMTTIDLFLLLHIAGKVFQAAFPCLFWNGWSK